MERMYEPAPLFFNLKFAGMEELQTKTLDIAISGKTISCQIKERDFGDLIVFDAVSYTHLTLPTKRIV